MRMKGCNFSINCQLWKSSFCAMGYTSIFNPTLLIHRLSQICWCVGVYWGHIWTWQKVLVDAAVDSVVYPRTAMGCWCTAWRFLSAFSIFSAARLSRVSVYRTGLFYYGVYDANKTVISWDNFCLGTTEKHDESTPLFSWPVTICFKVAVHCEDVRVDAQVFVFDKWWNNTVSGSALYVWLCGVCQHLWEPYWFLAPSQNCNEVGVCMCVCGWLQ